MASSSGGRWSEERDGIETFLFWIGQVAAMAGLPAFMLRAGG
jgi:hypothetical protein